MSDDKTARSDMDDADSVGFTDWEKAAMKERAKERKAEAKMAKDRSAGEQAIAEKIAEMTEPDRSMAQRIHEIVTETAPELMPRTWYGMPAYAKDGKVVVFFQGAAKFEARYSTLGFNDAARLDDGNMWPASFALLELTATEEKRVRALVKQAVG